MTIQQGAALYTQGFGSRPEDVEVPHIDVRAPASTDIKYPIGKKWVDYVNNNSYTLTSLSSAAGSLTANWQVEGGGTSALSSLTGDTGTAIPAAGNIKIAGTANQITTAAAGSTVTLSLPVAITAPGSLTTTTSLSATTTVTAGTGITSTTGNIDATAGTVTAGTTMTAGTGITSTTGNIVATAGAVNAGTTMTAGTGITSTTGNIVATAGQVNAGTSMTAGTTLTATLGDITATNGNLVLNTAGNKIVSTSVGTTTAAGANSFGSVTLTAGAATVSTTSVTASSLIVLWRQSLGATGANPIGLLTVGTIVAGTSFDIHAATTASATTDVATDVSVVGWMIIN